MHDNIKIICQNKKANHDYFIQDTLECGIVLTGTEIKSIRLGKVSINDAYCYIEHNELLISGMHIAKYSQGNLFNHDPDALKKLLAHKKEIIRLNSKVMKEGITLIPLKVYLDKGLCKVEIALAKGKKQYDKRETLKEKSIAKEMNKNNIIKEV